MQKAIIVTDKHGPDKLNGFLRDGWKVVSNRPMGGGGTGAGAAHGSVWEFKSLVIIEKEDEL